MKEERICHFFNRYRYWLLLLACLTTLAGCTVSQSDSQSSENMTTEIHELSAATITPVLATLVTVSPSVTPIIPPPLTPTPTLTATSTPSSTPSPSNTPTATSTSTPLFTLTPLPTIPPPQRGQVYTELMRNNDGCTLPCWWGFELGKTSIEEVRQFYATFGAFLTEQTGEQGISALYILFVDPQIEEGTQVRHIFLAQDGIVIEAEAQVRRQPNYQIEPILHQFGQPAEVWMWTIPDVYEGILPASFRLYYPEQGVLVAYAVEGVRVDNTVQVCFDKLGSVILGLWVPSIWDPDDTKGFVERANESSELGLDRDFYPIEEVSNWNAEQFSTILTDPTRSDCLQTPSDLWPAP
jgi:hypothetical protein